MFFIELWDRYLSKTMPSLTSLSLPLIFFQMLAGLPPLFSLYHSVRRDSAWERVLLCMVPGIFIITLAFIEPLFFSSFLGDGFPWTEALRHFLMQKPFFRESLALSSSFLLLSALTLFTERREGTLRPVRFLISVGAELFVSLFLLILAIDFSLGKGMLLRQLPDLPLKWLVYGIYLLLYKCGLLFICLLWRLLFGEHPGRLDTPADYRRWLRRYLSRGYRAFGWSVLMFSGLWAFAVVYGLYQEGSPYLWALALNIMMLLLGLGSLLCSLTLPAYRRILTWGTPEQTFHQLYQELIVTPPLAASSVGFLTEHYLVMQMPWRGIFCRALLDTSRVKVNSVGACVLCFRDGSRCRINTVYQQLLEPLLKEPKAYRPPF